jgi:transmembrane sensor
MSPAIDRVLDEAAEWMARLRSGDISEAESNAFEAWHDAHPLHQQVFQRMSEGIAHARQSTRQPMHPEHVIAALQAPSSRRRFVQGGMAGLALLGASTLGLRFSSGQCWPATDLQTATAERRTFEIPGGSRMTLNARTHLSVIEDTTQRLWHLHKGGLQLECTGVGTSVETPLCRFDAEPGSRALIERHGAGQVTMTVLAGQVQLTTRASDRMRVDTGHSVQVSPVFAPVLGLALPEAGAWLYGLVEARDQPLGELIDALRAYRRGIIRLSQGASGLHISGRFPLNDTSTSLRLVAASLPVTMTHYGELWTRIELAADA